MFKIVGGRAAKETCWNLDSVENDEARSLEWLISRQTQRPQAAGNRTHLFQLLSCGCLTKLLSTDNQSKTIQVAAWWLLHSLSFPSQEEEIPAWCNCFPLASAAGGIASFLTRYRLHVDSSDLCWSNWRSGIAPLLGYSKGLFLLLWVDQRLFWNLTDPSTQLPRRGLWNTQRIGFWGWTCLLRRGEWEPRIRKGLLSLCDNHYFQLPRL